MQILLTGGSGLLGRELRRLEPGLVAPTRAELDITDAAAVQRYIKEHSPDLILHAAAMTSNREVEARPDEAHKVNVEGTANLVRACNGSRIRFVYLSTDYVYKGDKGNYREDDPVEPFNLYAQTKLAGEQEVRKVPNHLIIRTSFGASKFDYPDAFCDKWSSKEYVDVIAPTILEAAKSPLTGVLHLGGRRRSLYEYAVERNPGVNRIERRQSGHKTPRDTSLNLDRWDEFVQGRGIVRGVTQCRVCGSRDLDKYLDLGMLPLANNLADSAQQAIDMERFPMQVLYCGECSLSQLSVVVDPAALFSHYTYRSSINKGYVRHCREMARSLKVPLQVEAGDLVVDVAGNDGALLTEFRDELGVQVVNVDPAENIAEIAEQRGIETLTRFWSQSVAQEIMQKYGRPKLITATNVFAHVDDVRGFLAAAGSCLRDDGALLLEFPYAMDFIRNREFDTIYFEHLSYVLIRPVVRLAAMEGLQVFKVEKHDIHGGTVRVFLGFDGAREVDSSVGEFLEKERQEGFHDVSIYREWNSEIDALIDDLVRQLEQLKRGGAKIAAFAASAKGNTLLNACRLDSRTVDYIVDDTPEKIGKFSPGTGIPIVDRSVLAEDPPEFLIILAWNFAREIIDTIADFDGRYIIPIPEFKIMDS
ncbi:MAG: sugar nucleotide-binding protein [Woeseiaceae bacterium]|nr:sugar nucleotide-binding protein [Woeseiaceae bacterium]